MNDSANPTVRPSRAQRLFQALDARRRRARVDRAFLPAALEVQDTPPSPVGRTIIASIIILFLVVVLWACVGQIDIVAVAPGKVVPSDRVKVIQPLEIGVVRAIYVREGESVKQGDALIALDATQAEADQRRLVAELDVARMDVARQTQFARYLDSADQKLTDIEWPPGLPAAQRAVQARLLTQQVHAFAAERSTLENQIRQGRAERRATAAEIIKLDRTLPIITQRAQRLATLLAKHLVAESDYLQLEQARIEAEQDLASLRARADGLDAALQTLISRERSLRADAMKDNLTALQNSQRHVAVLYQERVKASKRQAQQVLYAPIDGVVTDLKVSTVGGVVIPAENLMTLVPSDGALEVEAWVLNKDIGFVSEDDAVEVKIDTFNFTKYGVIDGQLVDLSNDARADERLGFVYRARVALRTTKLLVNRKWVNLSPGMTVTAEIKTGTRRIIEFFLSPLFRYRDESIRER